MPKRTQIVCLHEGKQGRSIDGVFLNTAVKDLNPAWLRPQTTGKVRFVPCDSRSALISRMPTELRTCLTMGGHTTLVVLADVDDDPSGPAALRELFWSRAESEGIERTQFDLAVFLCPRDRLENWIEFLNTGQTDEDREGPRIGKPADVTRAATKLAQIRSGRENVALPPSLEWSCSNWRALVERMGS